MVLVGSAMEINGSDLKYQQSVPTGSDEYLAVHIRYKAPGGGASKLISTPVGKESARGQLSANLRFAAAVAETGMLPRKSEYYGLNDMTNRRPRSN